MGAERLGNQDLEERRRRESEVERRGETGVRNHDKRQRRRIRRAGEAKECRKTNGKEKNTAVGKGR